MATPKPIQDAQPVEYEDVEDEEEVNITEKLEYTKLREQWIRENPVEDLDTEEPVRPAPSKKEKVRFADDTENTAFEEPLKENIGPPCEKINPLKAPSIDEEKRTVPSNAKPKAVLKERQPVTSFEKILPAPRKFSCVSIEFTDKPTLPDHLPARESRGNAPRIQLCTISFDYL